MRQGEWSESESLYRQALALRRKFFGAGHPDVADSLERLSDLLLEQGRPSEAEGAAREAVAVRKRILAKDRPSTRLEAAIVDPMSNDEIKSEAVYLGNLTTKTTPLPNEGALAASIRQLAVTLRAQGKWDEAKQAYLEAAQSGDAAAVDSAA